MRRPTAPAVRLSLLAFVLALLVPAVVPAAAAPAADVLDRPSATHARFDALAKAAPRLDPQVLALALDAAECALRTGAAPDARYLGVIDYSLPSTARRFWLFDLVERRLIARELVAHGVNTGANRATQFSNIEGSRQTSLGLFRTAETYYGSNGYSLRLDGLEQGFNEQARARAIVMHGAPYVSDEFVRTNGRLGRSWGCPAFDQAVSRQIIDQVQGGHLLFSYYPDEEWLSRSEFLNCPAAVQPFQQTTAASE